MKSQYSLYVTLFLIWFLHLIPIRNAQAQPFRFNSNSISNSLSPIVGDNADSAKSNPSNLVQLYAMLDFMNFMFFQTPGLGGQFYVGNMFGVSLSYSENFTISDRTDGSNLIAQAHLKLPVLQRKIILSYAKNIIIKPQEEFGTSDVARYAISLSYWHDIGKQKGFVLVYDLSYLNSTLNMRVMPSIKVLYQLY